MKVTRKEAGLIQYAIVHTETLWKPVKNNHGFEPATKEVQDLLNRIWKYLA